MKPNLISLEGSGHLRSKARFTLGTIVELIKTEVGYDVFPVNTGH